MEYFFPPVWKEHSGTRPCGLGKYPVSKIQAGEIEPTKKSFTKAFLKNDLLACFCCDLGVEVERVPVDPLHVGRRVVEGGEACSVPCRPELVFCATKSLGPSQ